MIFLVPVRLIRPAKEVPNRPNSQGALLSDKSSPGQKKIHVRKRM